MKTAFKIILSICLIGAIVYMLGGIGEVDAQIRNINPAYVVLVVVMVVLDRGLMTYKWGLLLRSRGIHLPFFRGMMIYCASWVCRITSYNVCYTKLLREELDHGHVHGPGGHHH